MGETWERLTIDYEHTFEAYKHLADLRFKLLAFVPTISGAAIALLTHASIPGWDKSIVAFLGFLVTFGIILYDQRNTQFYNGAISRAQHLERELGFPAFEGDKYGGLMGSRRSHKVRRFLGVRVHHDLGLALVYSPVLGAWAFAVVRGAWPSYPWLAALVGGAITVMALIQFDLNDRKALPKWRRKLRKDKMARKVE